MSVTHPVHKPHRVGLFVGYNVPSTVAVGDELLLHNGLRVEVTSLRQGRQPNERYAKIKGVDSTLGPIGVVFTLEGV